MVIGSFVHCIYRHSQQCSSYIVTTRCIGGLSPGRYNELSREFHGLGLVYKSYLYK